jgi:uncharacterized membrane protein
MFVSCLELKSLLVLFFRKEHLSYYRCALVLYFTVVAVLGTMLVFRATPMSGIDESYHFRRALQISEGHFLARTLGPNDWGGKLDRRLVAYEAWFDERRNGSRPSLASEAAAAEAAIMRTQVAGAALASFPSTASYPPVPYLPAALGLAFGRAIGLGLFGQVMAGRLGALAGWLGLLACVVRALPFGRFGALALLTMPAAIGVAASYSADPVTNGISCLFVALCLRWHLDEACVFGRWRKAGMLLLAACLGLLKLTCALLSISIILIPKRYFRTARQAWLFRLLGVTLAFGTAAIWNGHYHFVPGRYWGTGADPVTAVHLILQAPAHHAFLVAWNIQHAFYTYWSDAFSRFGNGPIPLWIWFNGRTTEVAVLVAFGLALSELRGDARSRKAGALVALLGCAYAVETVLAFKIGFSRPEATIIEGVQGRYWILPYALAYLGTVACLPGARRLAVATLPCVLVWLFIDVHFVLAASKLYATNWH